MNKKLKTVMALVILSAILPGCGNKISNNIKSSKTPTNQSASTSSSKAKVEITSSKLSFSKYKDLTDYAKEKTSKFSELLTKNKIENVVTTDNMYAVNTNQKDNIAHPNYLFHIDYTVHPDFGTGKGTTGTNIYEEKQTDEKYSSTDNKVIVIYTILSEMTDMEKMSLADFTDKLNKLDSTAKSSSERKTLLVLGKHKDLGITINYDDNGIKHDANSTQLFITYNEAFKNYIIKYGAIKFNTMAEYESPALEKKEQDKLAASLLKSNFTGQNGYKDGSSDRVRDYIKFRISNEETLQKNPALGYEIMGTLYNYSIDDSSKNNSSIGAIYDIITRFTLNDSLNKEEFIKYVQSTSIYQKYGLMANPINDEKSLIYQYYIPYTDIFITTANTSDGTLPMFNIAYVESTASRKSPSQLQIDIIFNVPVEAEGMTKK